MKILAIETSCDETAMAIVEVKKQGVKSIFKILGNEISSQIDIHKEYGGVFPALAKREHQKNLPIVFEKVLKQAKLKADPVRSRSPQGDRSTRLLSGAASNGIEKIDNIAVTTGPGLEPALWTGIVFARELSEKYKIPIIPVNHMEGHIFSIFPKKGKTFTVDLNKKLFPILSLLVSGGHTELILIKDGMKYKKIGQTRDDASGEAFDKVARMLNLPYPGGPEISRLASIERSSELIPLLRGGLCNQRTGWNALNTSTSPALAGTPQEENFQLPRPMMYSKDYDFSFSGLKTAVLYLIRDLEKKHSNILQNVGIKQMIAREFEDAVVDVLVHKTIKAIKEYKIKTLIVGGGVSANKYLQEVMNREIKNIRKSDFRIFKDLKVHFPSRELTGDNALMIAIAGYFQYKNKKSRLPIKANGNLQL